MPSVKGRPLIPPAQPDGPADGQGQGNAYERMAAAGDVDGLWRALSDLPGSLLDRDAVFRLLLRAAGVASRTDPRAFADLVFSHLVSFGAYLALLAQHNATALARTPARQGPSLVGGLDESAVRQVLDIQQHVAGLLLAQAQVARLRQLAGERESARTTSTDGRHRLSPARRRQTTKANQTRPLAIGAS